MGENDALRRQQGDECDRDFFSEIQLSIKMGLAWALPTCEKAVTLRGVAPKAIPLCEAPELVGRFTNAESLGESEERPTSAARAARAQRCARLGRVA